MNQDRTNLDVDQIAREIVVSISAFLLKHPGDEALVTRPLGSIRREVPVR